MYLIKKGSLRLNKNVTKKVILSKVIFYTDVNTY